MQAVTIAVAVHVHVRNKLWYKADSDVVGNSQTKVNWQKGGK